MSAQIIVLADRRTDRSQADRIDGSLGSKLAAAADNGPTADPYGLVAAVRALAADMEQMKTRGIEMRKTYQSLADDARSVVAETGTINTAVETLGDARTSLLCV